MRKNKKQVMDQEQGLLENLFAAFIQIQKAEMAKQVKAGKAYRKSKHLS